MGESFLDEVARDGAGANRTHRGPRPIGDPAHLVIRQRASSMEQPEVRGGLLGTREAGDTCGLVALVGACSEREAGLWIVGHRQSFSIRNGAVSRATMCQPLSSRRKNDNGPSAPRSVSQTICNCFPWMLSGPRRWIQAQTVTRLSRCIGPSSEAS